MGRTDVPANEQATTSVEEGNPSFTETAIEQENAETNENINHEQRSRSSSPVTKSVELENGRPVSLSRVSADKTEETTTRCRFLSPVMESAHLENGRSVSI